MPRQVFAIDPVETRSSDPDTSEIAPAPPDRALPRLVGPPPIAVKPERIKQSQSVMILESDLSIRKLLRRMLDRRGYFTHEVLEPSGLAAGLHERRVDLLILDAALMGVGAMDTILALADAHHDLKILALFSEPPHGREMPGGCLALVKPFSLDGFLESVDRLLGPQPA
jgi:DNA-binding NtrC family response regulator